jgi:hypothetical protein
MLIGQVCLYKVMLIERFYCKGNPIDTYCLGNISYIRVY